MVVTLGLLASLASGTAGASGGPIEGSREIKGDDIVGWRITLDENTPLVHALGIGAGQADCQVQRPKKNRLIAQCEGGVLAIIQENRELLIGCEKTDLDQCRKIFQDIMDHTPRSK